MIVTCKFFQFCNFPLISPHFTAEQRTEGQVARFVKGMPPHDYYINFPLSAKGVYKTQLLQGKAYKRNTFGSFFTIKKYVR